MTRDHDFVKIPTDRLKLSELLTPTIGNRKINGQDGCLGSRISHFLSFHFSISSFKKNELLSFEARVQN